MSDFGLLSVVAQLAVEVEEVGQMGEVDPVIAAD